MNWKLYLRRSAVELRPFTPGESLLGVSISDADLANGSPKIGDMIARNPRNIHDLWLVAEAFFHENYEPAIDNGGGK